MKIDAFKIERYFAKYELKAKYLLSNSDCDGFSLDYILDRADRTEKKLWDNLRFNYTEPQGLPQLREAIAGEYRTITPGQVVVLSPGEANFSFMNIVLKKGDHLICMWPAYQSLYQVARSLGCEVSLWKPQQKRWAYQAGDLQGLVKKNTKALIVNFPHNPTGFIPNREELQEIAGFARAHQLKVFSDEMYHQLVLDEENAIPAFCDIYEDAVSLWGLSKSFGLAGLRLGWIASGNQELLEGILSFKDYLSMCNNALSEVLAITVIKRKEDFIGHNLRKIRKNIQLFNTFCADHKGLLEFAPPRAGSTAFVRLRTRESTFDYCRKLMNETGIMLLPSEILEYGSGFIRIGFGRDNMREGLEKWGEFIELSNNEKTSIPETPKCNA